MKNYDHLDTMPIDSPPGTRLVFCPSNNGTEYDREKAAKHLKVGQVYTLAHSEIGGSRTEVFLKEIPGIRFNSVQFTTEEMWQNPSKS